MRLLLTGAVLAASGAFFAIPATADDEVVSEVGEWRVIARPQAGQMIDPLCILASPVAEDTLRFRLENAIKPGESGSTRGAALLDVRVPDRAFPDAEVVIEQMRIEVPGQAAWTGLTGEWSASGGGGRILSYVNPSIDAVIPPLARGSVMTIEVGPSGETKTYQFDLKGSYAALVAYEKCLARVKWVEPGSGS